MLIEWARRHKARLTHDKRRLAQALLERIRAAGRPATDWERALLLDAGIEEMK